MMESTLCTEHKLMTVACSCCTIFYCSEFYRDGVCPGCWNQKEKGHTPENCAGRKWKAGVESDPEWRQLKTEAAERRLRLVKP